MDTKVDATVTWMQGDSDLDRESVVVEGRDMTKLGQLLMKEQAGFSNKRWV